MVLNLLRWGEDIRSWEDLDLPPEGAKAAGLSDREMSMARQLVKDMTGKWDPHQFNDSFKQEIMALVERKVKEGKLETVVQPGETGETATSSSSAQVIDLTELLQRSLRKGSAPTTVPREDEAQTKPKVKAPASKSTAKTASRTPTKRRAA